MKLQRFKCEAYTVKQLTSSGAWLVETANCVDLGLLFLRAQEFYESADDQFRGKPFSLVDYIRWYSLNLGEDKSFDYFARFCGFNIPSKSLDAFLAIPIPDATRFDLLFAKIVSEIRGRQKGPYCLIGAVKGDEPTIDHEISHAMWDMWPAYKAGSQKVLKAMPFAAYKKARTALLEDGYSEQVIPDEVTAYMATGVAEVFPELEHLRYPFIANFHKHKRQFIGG